MVPLLPKILLFASLLVSSGNAHAADEPVHLTADRMSYDQTQDLLQAEGDVRAEWGGATLTARRIDYFRQQNQLAASGEVRLKRDRDWFTGDRATFAVATTKGVIEQPAVFLKQPNLHLSGSRLERSSAIDYAVTDGYFTTCDGEEPSWRINAAAIDITLEEYASARHALFYLGKVPIFYFPYLILPIKTERQSGLLIPTIGNSTKKGFSFSQPFYWVMSPSADATLTLDLQTRRGVGGGVELRYLRPQQSSGQFDGYALYDQNQGRTRGNVHLSAREELPAGITLRSDATQVTDREYFRDFTVESGDYNRLYLDSSAGLGWQGERALLGVEARTWRNLDPDRTDEPVQRLPAVTGRLITSPIGALPLATGISSSAVRFTRKLGGQWTRAEMIPALLSTVSLLPGVTLATGGRYQLRGYLPEQDSSGSNSQGVGIATAEAELSALFERSFATDFPTMQTVRHLLLPKAGFRYLQERNQEQLPFYDWDDRVLGQQAVVWSLANLVQGAFLGSGGVREWRDLLELRISQELLLTGGRRDLLAPADAGDQVGDVRLELTAMPSKELSIWLDSRYNPNRSSLSSLALAAEYQDLRDNRVGLGYYSARHQYEYLEGKLTTALFRPFLLEYRGRYSAERQGFLESFYSLEYRHQCWGIGVSYRDRPDNREVMVSFSLGSIGSLGKLKIF